MADKAVKDMFFPRICIVIIVAILAAAIALWLLFHAIFQGWGPVAILPPLQVDAITNPAPCCTQVTEVTGWLRPAEARLPRIEAWVYAVGLLLLLPVVLSLGIDWAAGPRRTPSPGPRPPRDKVSRHDRSTSRPRNDQPRHG